MKLPHIIDDLVLTLTRINTPNANMLDRRLLVQWLTNQRALWFANEVNKGRELMNNEIQSLTEVEMELDTSSSFYTTVPIGVSVMRSKKRLPRTIQFQTRDGLISIRPQNKQMQRFNYVAREQVPYCGNGKYNKSMIYFFKIDDYLYAKFGEESLKVNIPTKVGIEGVFENPLEVDTFNGTEDNIWDGVDEYPISMKFIEYLKNTILTTNFVPMMSTPSDTTANDENDVVNGTDGS